MKPLKLTMRNAGPFKFEDVDFTNLDNMFLVCGNTGAGKTSIFDAITFALYGKLNGARNNINGTKDFFSTYADQDENGYVIFRFEIFGNTYQITRTIPRSYINKYGEQTTTNSTLEFGKLNKDGYLINFSGKKTELEEKIKNLIGFNYEDFSRIVVLPQGQFSEFLKQKSSQRRETLSNLFRVDDYRAIVEDAKNQLAEKKQSIASIQLFINNLLESFNPETVDETLKKYETEIKATEKELEKEKNTEKATIVKKSELTSLYKTSIKNEQYREKLNELKKQEKSINDKMKKISLAEKAQSYAELIHNASTAKEALLSINEKKKQKEQEFAQSEKKLKSLIDKKEEIKELKTKQQENLLEEKRLNNLKNVVRKIATLKNNLKKVNDDFNIQGEELSDIKTEIISIKTEFQELSGNNNKLETELEKKKEQLRKSKEILRTQEEILSKVEERDELKKSILVLTKKYDASKRHLQSIKKLIEKVELKIKKLEELATKNEIQNASIILVKQLKNKSPCPICGSLDHPRPFVFKGEKINVKEELKETKEQLSINRKVERKCETEVTKFETQLKEKEKNLKKIPSTLPTLEKAQTQYDKTEEKISELNDLIDNLNILKNQYVSMLNKEITSNEKLNKSKSRVENIKTELKTLRKSAGFEENKEWSEQKLNIECDKLHKRIHKNNEEIALYEEKFELAIKDNSSLKSVVKEINENLSVAQKKYSETSAILQKVLHSSPFDSIEECENAMLEKSKLIKLKAEVNKWNEDCNKYEVLIAKEGNIEKSKIIQAEINQLDKNLSNTKEKIDKFTKKLLNTQSNKNELQKQNNDYIKNIKSLQNIQKEIEPYEMLSNDLSHRNPKGISFDIWVLAYYFTEVVSYANKRFYEISQGRYEFKISDQNSGNGYKGLDLLVTDSYTGKDRDTSTLSGGETFMASISLALALTDVVQNRNGGIQLDSIFIDEGFGTLDEETLNCAMSILNNLQETKMVGIISHIESMQTQIPSHIEVEKTMTGSHIKIV